MERIQQIIREDVFAQLAFFSLKIIQVKALQVKAKRVDKREIEEERASPAFSFRLHMNFTKLFGF